MADRPEQVSIYPVKKIYCLVVPGAPQIISKQVQLVEVLRVSGINKDVLEAHFSHSYVNIRTLSSIPTVCYRMSYYPEIKGNA